MHIAIWTHTQFLGWGPSKAPHCYCSEVEEDNKGWSPVIVHEDKFAKDSEAFRILKVLYKCLMITHT